MPAAAARPRKGAKERRDPTPRAVDAEIPLMKLVNRQDDQYHYVAVNPDGHDINSRRYYEALGYEVCITPTKDRAKSELNFLTGSESAEGTPLMQMGMIVMRLRRESFDDLERNGRFGSSGQSHADQIERRLENQAEAMRYADYVNRGDRTYFDFKNLGRGERPLGQDEALGDVRLGGEG